MPDGLIQRKSAIPFGKGLPFGVIWDRLRLPPAHMIHIGKTGGTSVKTALRNARSELYHIQLHGHVVRLPDIPESESFFFFLRDPCARYVSGFLSRQRRGYPRHDVAWRPDEALAFRRFSDPNALAEALSSNDPEERSSAENAMRSIRHVRDHFSDWFVSLEYLHSRSERLLFAGTQEHLSDDFDELKSHLRLRQDVCLPSDDVRSHRSPSGTSNVLSTRALHNLRSWYSEDYSFLEYVTTRRAKH